MWPCPAQKPACLSALFAVCALAGCAATPEQTAADAEAQALLSAEIEARKGAAVSRICPRGSEGWRALGNDNLLLEAQGQWYMVELSGACDPDSAFAAVARRGGSGSSCLTRGDAIFTAPPRSGGRCVITALYEWDENAKAAPSAGALSVKE